MPFRSLQPRAHFIDYAVSGADKKEYFVDFARDAAISAQYQHISCGPHRVPGADCPNCKRPLLRFLALDTRDPRLYLPGTRFRLLSLLYCWRCPVAREIFSYRLLDAGEVTLLRYVQGPPEDDFPYEDYPDFFPQAPARLVQITGEAQEVLRQQNSGRRVQSALAWNNPELLEPRHQYGGEPLLLQQDTEYRVECPVCGEPMPFLANIGADCLDPRGFVDDEFVQVLYHYCPGCQAVAAFNEAD